jgi:hypothetical protein
MSCVLRFTSNRKHSLEFKQHSFSESACRCFILAFCFCCSPVVNLDMAALDMRMSNVHVLGSVTQKHADTNER